MSLLHDPCHHLNKVLGRCLVRLCALFHRTTFSLFCTQALFHFTNFLSCIVNGWLLSPRTPVIISAQYCSFVALLQIELYTSFIGENSVLQHEVLKHEYIYIKGTAVQFVWLHWISIQWPGVDDEFSPRTPLIILSLPPPFQIHSPPLTQSLICQSYQHQWFHNTHTTSNYKKSCIYMSALQATQMKYRWSERKVLRHPLHLVSAIPQFISRVLFCGMFYNMFFKSLT